MTKRHFITLGVAVLLASAVGLRAQTTTSKVTQAAGDAKVTQEQINGEVVLVEGNWLLVKLQPSGHYRYFDIPPGRQFIIDGQAKLISDLKPGTVLKASTSEPGLLVASVSPLTTLMELPVRLMGSGSLSAVTTTSGGCAGEAAVLFAAGRTGLAMLRSRSLRIRRAGLGGSFGLTTTGGS